MLHKLLRAVVSVSVSVLRVLVSGSVSASRVCFVSFGELRGSVCE